MYFCFGAVETSCRDVNEIHAVLSMRDCRKNNEDTHFYA